jgi:hypothetical protein
MKLRNIKIIGVLLVVLINLFGAQPALAVNPQDTSYSTNIDKYYNSVIVVEAANYGKLLNQPTYSAARTSAKYKAWVKKVNSSGSKISAAYSKLAALTAGPSYTKSDALLKISSASSLNYYATYKKVLAKKKSMEADTTLLNDLTDKVSAYGKAWLISYQQEFSVANLSAPTTAPNVKFTSESGNLIITLEDKADFNQMALRITSYKFRVFKNPDIVKLVENFDSQVPFWDTTCELSDETRGEGCKWTIEGVNSGEAWAVRVQASNSLGSGPWGTLATVFI